MQSIYIYLHLNYGTHCTPDHIQIRIESSWRRTNDVVLEFGVCWAGVGGDLWLPRMQ